MPTFQEHRQAAVTSLELMAGATNALSGPEAGEEWGDAGAQYAEKGALALAIARNPESDTEQWQEVVTLLQECRNLATAAEEKASEEATDQDQQDSIENACEWARRRAYEAMQEAATAAAWLEGFREGRQGQAGT